MATIEQVLASKRVFEVVPMACMQHAEILKSYERLREKHVWSDAPKDVQLLFKIAFVAICHQFNWDFMQAVLARELLPHGRALGRFLEDVSASTVEQWLHTYPKKERIRPKERARLLRDVGRTLREHFGGDSIALYRVLDGVRLGGDEFRRAMDLFEAFRSDPLRKKANVLAHDLYKEEILEFSDPENIEPAIDYHIMRLYLRTGRVVPVDEVLFPYLKGAPNPRGALVRALRAVVADAERLTATYAGLSVADVNFVEWQIGRAICTNAGPQCHRLERTEKLSQDVRRLSTSSGCPYKDVCLANNELGTFIEFEEPVWVSSDY